MSGFVSRNKPVWDELEALLRRARRSVRRMSVEDLARLDELYRRTTIHLSQVSTRSADVKLRNYLNGLVSSAHSLIYLQRREPLWKSPLRFAAEGFPRTIARQWREHLLSAVLLLAGGILAYFAVIHDPFAAYALLPASDVRQPGSAPEQLLDVLRSGRDSGSGQKFFFASFLLSHNLKVGLLALATGVLAAVPTVLLMVFNGMLLGAFAAIHHQAGIAVEFWAWILPHGITELAAIVFCGGAGLTLGKAVVRPGLASRGESLRQAGMEAGRTSLGVAAMLVFAAVIESYLRQSHLSDSARLGFAAATGLFWVAYLTHGILRERAARRAPADSSLPPLAEDD